MSFNSTVSRHGQQIVRESRHCQGAALSERNLAERPDRLAGRPPVAATAEHDRREGFDRGAECMRVRLKRSARLRFPGVLGSQLRSRFVSCHPMVVVRGEKRRGRCAVCSAVQEGVSGIGNLSAVLGRVS